MFHQQEPDYAAACCRVSRLTDEELKQILNEDEKFEEVVAGIQQFKEIETEKEMLLASIKSLAEFNLSKQQNLEEGKRRVAETSEIGEGLCKSIESKLAELKDNPANLNSDTILALLQAATAECEEESETTSEKFLNGDITIDEFLDKFLLQRKILHLRRVKVEKMSEILTRKPRTSITTTTTVGLSVQFGQPHSYSNFPLPPVAGQAPYPVHSAPYPLGPMSMPFPGQFRPDVF